MFINHLCRVLYLLLILISLVVGARVSASPPSLRIEMGTHTSSINRLDADASGKLALTCADDKTGRIWDLATGQLLQILRPPLGEGDEGKLYSCALSPDGKTAALGGWTSPDGKNTNVYLFATAGGNMSGRLKGLPNRAYHLAYSHNGRWLAVMLGPQAGLRLYDTTKGYQLAFNDALYDDKSQWADFSLDNKSLVTSCWDGLIRLYKLGSDETWNLAAKRKTIGGEQPYGVSFAPDGSGIAIGYTDNAKLSVWSGADLRPLYAPDVSGVKEGDLSRVAWSPDGATLYAGGRWFRGEDFYLRSWAGSGRGAYRDLAIAKGNIVGLVPLPDGGLLYGTTEPAFGVVKADGTSRVRVRGNIADYRGLNDNFRLTPDAMGLQFSYEMMGRMSAKFSLLTRALAAGELSGRAPLAETADIKLTNWLISESPKLNGKPISLAQYETSRCFAIAPAGDSFLLGTNFYLRAFESSGKARWLAAVPGQVLAVNVAANSKLAVAAFADGTMRWYRLKDGAELLAFFPHADRIRWVLWTPTGYFDASPGAEELIGWHINNGLDARADFYPVARFFEQFYRPDLMAEVLRTVATDREAITRRGEKERLNVAATGIKPPPRVAFLPLPGEVDSTQLELRLTAEDLGGGVDEVRVYQNGKLISDGTRNLGLIPDANGVRKIPVTLLEGENRFSVVALSKDRVESAPAETIVRLKGMAQAADLYCLIVGINKYRNPALNLNYAEPDAVAVNDFFASSPAKRLFRQVFLHTLLNEKATLDNVRQSFAEVEKKARPQDVIVVYLAGHGDTLENVWYFIPHDVPNPEDEGALKNGGFSSLELAQALQRIKAQKVFVMIDACKAGGALVALRGVEDRKAIMQLSRSTGTYIIAAATGEQLASEVKQLGHGVFTYVLLQGLSGKAGSGKVTVEGLMQYVKNNLPDITEKYRGKTQYPVSRGGGTDFPIAIY